MEANFDAKASSSLKEYWDNLKTLGATFKWVWTELVSKDARKLSKRIFLLLVIFCLVDACNPIALRLIFDGLSQRIAGRAISYLSIILGIAFLMVISVTTHVVRYFQTRMRKRLEGLDVARLDKRTSELFFEKSLGMHINESNTLNEANVKKGFERVLQLEHLMLHSSLEMLLGLLLPYCALWIFFWRAALIFTLIMIAYVIVSIVLNQQVIEICTPIDKKWRFLNRYQVERWHKVVRVKTSAKEKEEVENILKHLDDAWIPDQEFWLWFWGLLVLRGTIKDQIFFAGVVGYGAFAVWHGHMTIGWLYPLVAWGQKLAFNLWQLSDLEHTLNAITPAIMSLKEALTLPIGIEVRTNLIRLPKDSPCRIEFENISYTYTNESSDDSDDDEGETQGVLENISFIIEPGEKLGVIGKTGAGKTTIAKLLLRFMDPTSGRILIDGHDLRDIDLTSWLELVGYIPQHAEIFDGTIRYNMTYGLPKAERGVMSDAVLWQWMKRLKIDFGKRLTEGLDTKIGYQGLKLSGGQNQRLMILAAVIKNPKFMIIDEATSSLDATTERHVQAGMTDILEGRGALIVTHRLNTVRRVCDKFLMLDADSEGQQLIRVTQNFEELAAQSQNFRLLCKDQGIQFASLEQLVIHNRLEIRKH